MSELLFRGGDVGRKHELRTAGFKPHRKGPLRAFSVGNFCLKSQSISEISWVC